MGNTEKLGVSLAEPTSVIKDFKQSLDFIGGDLAELFNRLDILARTAGVSSLIPAEDLPVVSPEGHTEEIKAAISGLRGTIRCLFQRVGDLENFI